MQHEGGNCTPVPRLHLLWTATRRRAISEEVTIGIWPSITLSPGQTVCFNHNWPGMMDGNHWQRMSGSPDNFPSSLEITSEWQWTDAGGVTHFGVCWRNNGSNTVVF